MSVCDDVIMPVLRPSFTTCRLLLRYLFTRSNDFNGCMLEVSLPYVYSYLGPYTVTIL